MTFADLAKSLIDDFVRYRWRDVVALFLILTGLWVLMHSQDGMARDSAKGLIGAGLIMIDPRAMLPGTRPNGTPPAPQSTMPKGWGPK